MTDPTARDLIQRLADALTAHGPLPGAVPLLNEARAYLLQPVDLSHLSDDEHSALCPQGYHAPASVAYEPSDAELLELMPETMRDEFSYAATVCSDATGGQVKPGIFRVCLNHSALEYARAVLARWGSRTPAPIPLSERYPNLRPDGDDFSKDGCLWWYEPRLKWRWAMRDAIDCIPYPTHWLPHWALPMPAESER
jgi:hypothetical protein